MIYERYRRAGRQERQRILDEVCLTTNYHRKYAIRLLNGPPPGAQREKKTRGRKPRYGKQVIAILAAVWEAAGYPVLRHPEAVCAAAIQRVENGEPVVAVAHDIDVHQRLPYGWVARARRAEEGELVRQTRSKDLEGLLRENQQLKQALAEAACRVFATTTSLADDSSSRSTKTRGPGEIRYCTRILRNGQSQRSELFLFGFSKNSRNPVRRQQNVLIIF